MEQILNFRLLADGLQNKDGKKICNIYRSADVSSASDNDIAKLNQLKITNIIDLRSESERGQLLEVNTIDITNIDIIGNGNQNLMDKYSTSELSKMMNKLYEYDFVETDGFKTELEHIQSLDGQPFLFHCTAGKDRTGITGIILMYLLDFDYDCICSEYLKTDEVLVSAMMNKALNQFDQFDVEIDIACLRAVASVNQTFLDLYIAGINDKFGSVDNYVKTKLGISEEMIEHLHRNYLR